MFKIVDFEKEAKAKRKDLGIDKNMRIEADKSGYSLNFSSPWSIENMVDLGNNIGVLIVSTETDANLKDFRAEDGQKRKLHYSIPFVGLLVVGAEEEGYRYHAVGYRCLRCFPDDGAKQYVSVYPGSNNDLIVNACRSFMLRYPAPDWHFQEWRPRGIWEQLFAKPQFPTESEPADYAVVEILKELQEMTDRRTNTSEAFEGLKRFRSFGASGVVTST